MEELEYLEYERLLAEEKEQNNATKKQVSMTTLDDRLQAMRLAKKNASRTKVQVAGAAEKEDVMINQSAPIRSRLDYLVQSRQKVEPEFASMKLILHLLIPSFGM